MLEDQVEQRRQAGFAFVGRFAGPAVAADREQGGEIELVVGGVERGEQVEHFVVHLVGSRVAAVDLVDDDDRAQAQRERLLGHELGLRHRPFGRVDQDDHAIDHRQDALDLAAEIGMAGRVDDIDAHTFPEHRGAFSEDGDAALALELVQIHHALGHLLVGAERARLFQHGVDQGGLAVVDMGDDGDIAKIHDGNASPLRPWP